MNIEDAWRKYADDCEEMRQAFLRDPMAEKYPHLKANAHFLLQQTQAMAYNLVMAPRQHSPCFMRHEFFEPLFYTAHQPNPDFAYQLAFVDGARRWRITGKRNTARWVDIQVMRGWWGEHDFAGVENYDLDQDFAINPDGAFEIIASAKPEPGNWLRLDPDSPNNSIQVRPALYDWSTETPPDFHIEALDEIASPAIIHGEAEIIRRLALSGEMIKHSIGRWTTRASPRLAKNPGINAFVSYRGDASRGGANPLAQYGQAVYELAEDEALIIETENPDAPYWGISLGTWWWETIDPTHYQSSINGHQAALDSDGKFRAVLCRRDPGVPNWLDPVCWDVGIILVRWYRAQREQHIVTKKVRWSELRQHLPPDTPTVSPEQRKAIIEARRRGAMRWYGY